MIRSYNDILIRRRLDNMKLSEAKLKMVIGYINVTFNRNLNGLYSPNQRRLYSTSRDALNRLKDIKTELGSTLEPILKKNVLDYKKDPSTI